MNNIRTKRVLSLLGLISIAVFVSAAFWNNLNHSFFIRLLFDDAREFANQGTITSNFMPIGYSGFLGLCLKIGGEKIVPACQALIYVGILLVSFWFLKIKNLKGALLVLGVLIIAFHPMLLLNVWRIHDGNLTVFLLFGFLAAGLSFLRFKGKSNIIIWGIFAGLLSVVRQNALSLFLPAVFFLVAANRGEKKNKKKLDYLGRVILFLTVAMIFMVGVNLTVKQKPFFFGQQGAYNFYSGTNEYAYEYLLKDFSGENSLGEALKNKGFNSALSFEDKLSFPSETYNRLALEFIKDHPLEYLKLTGLKLLTFLRPGYHAVPGIEGWQEVVKRSLKIILALPFFVWAFLIYKTRNKFFDRENLFLFSTIILYSAPFLIANADPRYRFPLDMVFIVDSFCRLNQLSKRNSSIKGFIKVPKISETTGKHHFFGYYDICPWNAEGEKILAHEVDFIDRMPMGNEPAGIGYFTKKEGFKKIAETTAWNFQQGARLQWLSGRGNQVIFNSREDDGFISTILDIETGKKKTLPAPIYAVHFSGEYALSLNFARLNWVGGYGYPGIPDKNKDNFAPKDDGIYKIDLKTGASHLIFSIAEIANFKNSLKINSPHYLTMMLFNPRGDRFAFLHRFKLPDGGIHTRLFTANPDGTGLYLSAEGTLSHFDWFIPSNVEGFSDDQIFVWGRKRSTLINLRKKNVFNSPILKPLLSFARKQKGFLRHQILGDQLLLFKDKAGYVGSIGENKITEDGHFTRYKDTDWILGDTYPDKNHFRDLFLFNLKTKEKLILERFYSLVEKVPESWDLSAMRSDLHPRFSRDGKQVCIDSVHEGTRQIYVFDVSNIINEHGKN